MRKLLLGTTALAAAATLSANVATADVSFSGAMEFTYSSNDTGVASTGSSFDKFVSDSDLAITFENKTDSGLTVGMVQKIETITAGDASSDEAYIYVKGGFGSVTFGQDDGAGDQLTRTAHDLVGPDALSDGGGSVIGYGVAGTTGNLSDDNADLINDINDENAITYILPTMGGLTVGASYKDAGSGTADNADETVVAAKYEFESGAVKGAIHYGNNSISGKTTGAGSSNSTSMAIDITSGPFRAVIAKAEDDKSTAITTEVTDYGISYDLGNGLTLAAVGTQIESNTASEKSDVTTVSAKYNIASGLDAYFTYHDYDYEAGTSGDTSDDGSWTHFTIKASF